MTRIQFLIEEIDNKIKLYVDTKDPEDAMNVLIEISSCLKALDEKIIMNCGGEVPIG